MDPHEHARGAGASATALEGVVIGLSASIPPSGDLGARHVTSDVFLRAVADLVVSLVDAGAEVRYAGDDRPGGVTATIDAALGDAVRPGRFDAVRRSATTDDLDEIRASVVDDADLWVAIGGDRVTDPTSDRTSGVVDEIERAMTRRIPVVLATGFGGATADVAARPTTGATTSATDATEPARLVGDVVRVARSAANEGER